MTDTYDIGGLIPVAVTFEIAGEAEDPTTVTLTVMDPSGNVDTYTYALGQITRSAKGVYYKNIALDEGGIWTCTYTGTGTVVAVQTIYFFVRQAASVLKTILTAEEAAIVLRCDSDDTNMLQLLPLIDAYIETATGRDWTADTPIYAQAKSAARMLLVRWHEDPGGMASGETLGQGLGAVFMQLEAKALVLASDGVPSEALAIVATNINGNMAVSASFVIVFNHEMSAAATSAVALQTASGGAVGTTNSLDVTKRIMTVTPSGSLAASSSYSLVITDAADVYGQTIEQTVTFVTA